MMYAIGRPWNPELGDSGGVCFYAYHTEIHEGSLEDAIRFKKYAERQEDEEYFIYELIRSVKK